jgi:hypothetical protein
MTPAGFFTPEGLKNKKIVAFFADNPCTTDFARMRSLA